jgi:tRNA modification GTPase
MNPGCETGATIYALASGAGKSAVAIIRISGPKANVILRSVAGASPPARAATLLPIQNPKTGEILDHGVVLWFPAPRSFTGEDCVELQVHGSRAVVRAILDVLAAFPETRMARPGEFARRALANGKLDLVSVEALADLIDAETEQQRRLATIAASGALQKTVGQLRGQVLDLMALVETELDFSDEGDAPHDVASQIQRRIPEIRHELESLRSTHDRAELIREGLSVLIAGPPNAGKSSLLNALARREAAIVSEYAGTTRDLIEVKLDLGGFPVNVIDTAGIRESEDPIEREGIHRALTKSRIADLVLWLVPLGSQAIEPPEELLRRPMWRIATKADLSSENIGSELSGGGDETSFDLSVKTGLNLEFLMDRLQVFADENMTVASSLVVANARQKNAIDGALDALADAERINLPLEILAEDLRRACFALEELIGKVGVEDILDSLFARFCIGK